MRKGIDISTFQKNIDYKKLKEQGIEFAIIRCGYGKDSSQKDAEFETHYRGLKDNGIKIGAYLYSYATSPENAIKEAKNCINFIKGKKFELPIFYDLEDKIVEKQGRVNITQSAINFCEIIEKEGYKAGIYANKYWFKNLIDISKVEKYYIWLAQWADSYTVDFRVDLWQYTSTGKILGINGNVDLDIDYNCINENDNSKKTNEEIAEEVIKGMWDVQPKRQQLLEESGYNYKEIQKIVNNKMSKQKTDEEIADEIIKKPNYGGWGTGEERKNKLTNAGYNARKIQEIINKKLSK